ncbi:Hypp2023 [Branchiostoma lanceolatum]|uniref:Hypp2023 protein n=1 Tax=Branchiostoma lanceolatum TaxID=7740 RepID=A0A8K0ENI1_BRALA|nr:Hypp2023 [Branchiostoma lanceolatum]
MLAVLLAVLVTTTAAVNRLDRRSSPSKDKALEQKRANLLALLEDDDNDTREPSDVPVLGERLTEEEAEALVKYLQEPAGGFRRPALDAYRPDVEQVEREKKTSRLLSWAAQMLRMMTTRGGIHFRFGKRDGAEVEER